MVAGTVVTLWLAEWALEVLVLWGLVLWELEVAGCAVLLGLVLWAQSSQLVVQSSQLVVLGLQVAVLWLGVGWRSCCLPGHGSRPVD